MDEKALAEYIDNQRWLMNNGLLNDAVKNQLFMYGSIVHKEVQAVELAVDVEKKSIHYQIFVSKELLKKHELYKKLSTSTNLFGLWRFKRLLKKEGNLNFEGTLNRFVRDFCGPKWSTKIEILDVVQYIEGFDKGDEQPDGPGNNSPGEPAN